ncbi:MAG: pteridine reductase, partial [Methylophilaceae bacterium]|nr:pteridine reductase [Methylophilaceae bacterium]
MSSNLQNKVVLITGGAKRVGAAISRELHAHGASLMIHYNTSKQAAEENSYRFARTRD